MFRLNFINFLKSYKSSIIILSSIFFGVFVGIIMGEKARIFLPLGDIFINLTFTIATPLIFFSISSSIANVSNIENTKKTMIISFIVFFTMSCIASIFMLLVVKIFPFVNGSEIHLTKSINVESVNIIEKISSIFTVSEFGKLLSKSAILPLIIFSIFFGLAVNLLKEKGQIIKKQLNNYANIMFKIVKFLMYYAPIGLFAYFASFFGSSAKDLFGPLAGTVIVYYVFGIGFAVVFYSLFAYISAGYDGIKSLKHLLLPTATALATQSSLASLPANFEASERINVPYNISSLTLPLGSIIHLDGSSLLCVLKISFLFSIFNLPLSGIEFYFGVLMFSIFVSFMSAGIPGGGLVLEVLIIIAYGFPMEALPILILINYLVDPIATAINTDGNVVGTMLITRFVKGKNWIVNGN